MEYDSLGYISEGCMMEEEISTDTGLDITKGRNLIILGSTSQDWSCKWCDISDDATLISIQGIESPLVCVNCLRDYICGKIPRDFWKPTLTVTDNIY
jgi:hypothetical protein